MSPPIVDPFAPPLPPSDDGRLIVCTLDPSDGAGASNPAACPYCGHATGPGHAKKREVER